jgi:hypothetical protein
VRAEKRATKSDKIIVLFSETETAKQNQKFPFHFFFRFAAEGWGEETREKCKEIFWFLHTRVRGALYRFPTQSGRTGRFRATTRVARAISRQNPADFSRSTFELRPIHTAKIGNQNQKPKWGRREAPTQTHSRQEFPNSKGFSTLRVAHSFANTIL